MPEGRVAHSFHGYFLRIGDASKPIIYDVDCIRDGKSFTTRRVRGVQFGKAIFNLSASFQKVEEGFDHQDEMPEAPDPDTLISELWDRCDWRPAELAVRFARGRRHGQGHRF